MLYFCLNTKTLLKFKNIFESGVEVTKSFVLQTEAAIETIFYFKEQRCLPERSSPQSKINHIYELNFFRTENEKC